MSLFEWFGESYMPGSMDSVRFVGDRPDISRGMVIFCFTLSVALLGGVIFGVIYSDVSMWKDNLLTFIPVLSIYLAIAYFINPKPDMDNVGFFGGLMDHPFRFSDDINRYLLGLKIILWPGRFVSQSIVSFAVMMLHIAE